MRLQNVPKFVVDRSGFRLDFGIQSIDIFQITAFSLRGNMVFSAGFSTGLFLHSLNAIRIISSFKVIEVLARNAINAAGLRNVLEKFCKSDCDQFAINQFS